VVDAPRRDERTDAPLPWRDGEERTAILADLLRLGAAPDSAFETVVIAGSSSESS
jgi:hypothetical protein